MPQWTVAQNRYNVIKANQGNSQKLSYDAVYHARS